MVQDNAGPRPAARDRAVCSETAGFQVEPSALRVPLCAGHDRDDLRAWTKLYAFLLKMNLTTSLSRGHEQSVESTADLAGKCSADALFVIVVATAVTIGVAWAG